MRLSRSAANVASVCSANKEPKIGSCKFLRFPPFVLSLLPEQVILRTTTEPSGPASPFVLPRSQQWISKFCDLYAESGTPPSGQLEVFRYIQSTKSEAWPIPLPCAISFSFFAIHYLRGFATPPPEATVYSDFDRTMDPKAGAYSTRAARPRESISPAKYGNGFVVRHGGASEPAFQPIPYFARQGMLCWQ
jgi:hypothetical protein